MSFSFMYQRPVSQHRIFLIGKNRKKRAMPMGGFVVLLHLEPHDHEDYSRHEAKFRALTEEDKICDTSAQKRNALIEKI